MGENTFPRAWMDKLSSLVLGLVQSTPSVVSVCLSQQGRNILILGQETVGGSDMKLCARSAAASGFFMLECEAPFLEASSS